MADNNTKRRPPLAEGVDLLQLEPQPVLSIRRTIQVAELGNVMGESIPALLAYLKQWGAQPTGPVFVRYHTFGEIETDLEIGAPVAEQVAGQGTIAAGSLPGGPAIATWHVGPHNELRTAYARINAWPNEHGRETGSAAWEEYYWIDPREQIDPSTQSDPTTWRTRLVQPLK